MLQQIPPLLFLEWYEFFRIHPFGEERADLRNAMLMCFIANALRGKKGRRAKVADFLPKFDTGGRRESAESIKAKLMSFAQVHNAAIEQQKKRGTWKEPKV